MSGPTSTAPTPQPIVRPADASTAPNPMARVASAAGASQPVSIRPTILPPSIPAIFSELGFVQAGSPNGYRRLFITSEGENGSGKTNLIRTMPGPIGVVDFDRGTEGVLDVYKNAEGIPVNIYGQPILRRTIEFAEFDEGGKTMSAAELLAARDSYKLFKHIVEKLVRAGTVRTIAIDTGGAAYALAQAARFGQIAQVGEVPAQMWTSMQQEFENIFLQAYDAGCNVIVTHRQGAKFKGLSGEKELKGYKQMQHLSQIHLIHQKKLIREPVDPRNLQAGTRERLELSIKVGKCRQRVGLVGHEFPIFMTGEDENGVMQSVGGSFADIATAVFPNTSAEDWIK